MEGFVDKKSLVLLEKIFEVSRKTRSGVDVLNFRANHEDQLDDIDRMESVGLLRKEGDKYFVSLVGLELLCDGRAKELLARFDEIFDVLRKFYKRNQRDHLVLGDLSRFVQLPLEEVRLCLSYMVEGLWWGGRSTDFYAAEGAYIKPSESILKYKTFRDVIAQMREWIVQRISDRTHHLGNSVFTRGFPAPSFRNIAEGALDGAIRQKPDWYEKLDVEYRTLLDEVYLGLASGMQTLPAMGLRTIIDIVCNKLVGDLGQFGKKLDALLEGGHVNKNERDILAIAVDVGSASAHRGYMPNMEDLNTLLDIVEHLLKGVYVLRPASQRLKSATPSRRPVTKKVKK